MLAGPVGHTNGVGKHCLPLLCHVFLHSLFSDMLNLCLPTTASALKNGDEAAYLLLRLWWVLREVTFKEGSVCDSGAPSR